VIFFLLLIFFQYPPVDAKSAEVDLKEDFEDTKGAIRFRISTKNRQHNDQMKKYTRTNNDQQNIHIKLKIEI
jgi:type II secretory pathway component PulL